MSGLNQPFVLFYLEKIDMHENIYTKSAIGMIFLIM